MMIKAAVCISGLPRSFKRTHKMLVDNVLSAFDKVDCFISTWNPIGGDLGRSNSSHHDGTAKELIDLYNTKLYKIEDYDSNMQNKLLDKIGRSALRNATLAMFYKIEDVNNLRLQYEKNNNVKYDIVIRTRPDLNFFNKISQDEINDVLTNGGIYMRRNCEVFKDACGIIINDCFAFGRPEEMTTYSNIYSNLRKTLNDPNIIWNKKHRLGGDISPENVFRCYLLNNNLNLKCSSIKHNVKRDGE
jgi:hypothetical protein